MGVYYKWVCEDLKECFDPGEILGPNCPQGGYGVKSGSIPHSAWIVGALMTSRWFGRSIRLVNDGNDAYDYDYDEVSQYVLRELIHEAPHGELRSLANKVLRSRGETVSDEEESDEHEDEESRAKFLEILSEHAQEDWPPRCEDENCLSFGERHPGGHVPIPPVPEPEYIPQQFAIGLGRVEASPGETVSLGAETSKDFWMDSLILDNDVQCFMLLRISIDGMEMPIIPGVSAAIAGREGLPLPRQINPCHEIKVELRNVASIRSKITGAAIGTVMAKNPGWEQPGGRRLP